MVPGKPCELMVTESTKNYVVLSWQPPGEKGHGGVMYYVEKVRICICLYLKIILNSSVSVFKILLTIIIKKNALLNLCSSVSLVQTAGSV